MLDGLNRIRRILRTLICLPLASLNLSNITGNILVQSNPLSLCLLSRLCQKSLFITLPLLCENQRGYRGLILSCAQFRLGDVYLVYAGGLQMAYTGTDVMSGPGGFIPGEGGQWPEGGIDIPGDWEDMPQPPEGDFTLPPPPSEGMDPVPQGTPPTGPQGTPPSAPMGTPPQGQNPPTGTDGEPNIHFKIQDKVNFFSGLTPVS